MKDTIITTAALAAVTAFNLYGCDDTREPRFIGVDGVTAGGGIEVDPCDPLPDTCEVGDECGCWGGEPGERPFRGTTFCDVTGESWTECAP